MVRYTAKMSYSEETIYKLTAMQHRTFKAGSRMIMIAISICALFAGFSLGMSSTLGVVLIFGGCILLTGLNSRPRATAKAFEAQLAGKYPALSYTFTDRGFSSQDEKTETPYSSVIRLVDDGTYYYVYVSQEKAYMIDASTVKKQSGSSAFKEYISGKTAQEWIKPISFFNFNFKALRNIVRK